MIIGIRRLAACQLSILAITLLLAVACGQAEPAAQPQSSVSEEVVSQRVGTPAVSTEEAGQTAQPEQPVPTGAAAVGSQVPQPSNSADAPGQSRATAEPQSPTESNSGQATPGPNATNPGEGPATGIEGQTQEQPQPSPIPSPEPPKLLTTNKETDREVLAALYHATNGDNWSNNENWLSDEPIATWYGVNDNYKSTERLVELDLAANGLAGKLPANIWHAGYLRSLYLEDNNISGELPPLLPADGTIQIGSGFSLRLEEIDLTGNPLEGCIPLFLSDTRLQDIIEVDSLQPCANPDRQVLTDLFNATGGPQWPEKARNNWLTEAPLGHWPGVQVSRQGRVNGLDLPAALTGDIPASISELEYLKSVRILPTIQTRHLARARMNNESLQPLREQNNNTSQLTPQSLVNLAGVPSLEQLSLSVANTEGALPPEIGDLKNLKQLELPYNELIGPIPPEIGNLQELETLDLQGNRLTAMPPEIWNLENLQALNLSFNLIEGTIPSRIGNLAELQTLELASNMIGGTIPPELGSLEKLRIISLERNMIAGTVPRQLGDLKGLQEEPHAADVHAINLAHNQLTGEIPRQLGSIRPYVLDLSNNQLTGSIPRQLGSIRAGPREIRLSNNRLSGEIPGELVEHDYLRVLDLSNNQLSGEIPDDFRNADSLRELNLANNQLTGELPTRLAHAGTDLYLSGNQFTGCVSRDLGFNLEDLNQMGLPPC